MEILSPIKAPRLKANETVGIIAPASPVSKSEILSGLQLLESFPLEVRLGSHLFNHSNYLAGTDQDRVSDIHKMFSDQEIKTILCARGGYGSARILHSIDFNLIRKNPKVVVGYSDLTALLLALYRRCGLITIHGPTVFNLPNGNNWHYLFQLITTSHKPQLTLKHGKVINPGKARGILLGGNLATICSLLGTPYLPSLEGAILFLEEKGEALYRLDRMFTHLLLSGRLKYLSGLVMGQMKDCGEEDLIYSLLAERFGELNIPVVTGLPVGHETENMSLPLGVSALLDTDKMVLKIEESAVY